MCIAAYLAAVNHIIRVYGDVYLCHFQPRNPQSPIRQPWAWAIVNGFKPIENRSWWCGHLGPLLIHASKTFDENGFEFIEDEFPEIELPPKDKFEKGGLIGIVEMTGCVSAFASRWFFGPHGFVFENARPLPFVPCRGLQGVFNPFAPASRMTQADIDSIVQGAQS